MCGYSIAGVSSCYPLASFHLLLNKAPCSCLSALGEGDNTFVSGITCRLLSSPIDSPALPHATGKESTVELLRWNLSFLSSQATCCGVLHSSYEKYMISMHTSYFWIITLSFHFVESLKGCPLAPNQNRCLQSRITSSSLLMQMMTVSINANSVRRKGRYFNELMPWTWAILESLININSKQIWSECFSPTWIHVIFVYILDTSCIF